MLRGNPGTLILVFLLSVISLSFFFYKSHFLGLPVSRDQQVQLWNVEARIQFDSPPGPAQIRAVIPADPAGFRIVGEDFISGNYGLSVESKNVNRYAHWTVRRAQGTQSLYYRIQLKPSDNNGAFRKEEVPAPPEVPNYGDMEREAAMAILEEARRSSADVSTFVREFLKRFNNPTPSENYRFFLRQISSTEERLAMQQHILAGARIPSRMILGFELAHGKRQLQLTPWLQVHNGSRWFSFDPETGKQGLPSDFFIWSIGNEPLISGQGAENIRMHFSSALVSESMQGLARRLADNGSFLLVDSFLNLPLHTQNLFKTILLIPLGALLVVFMRNVAGIPTFGTFMPVLIAMSFKETNFGFGVLLFSVIVILGLSLRAGLERLNLLLVPRLASVLIVVVMSMAAITLLSHKTGMSSGLSVALFPMVILTMTIERMSIVWEESGARDALGQGLGSLAVAAAGFWIFQSSFLEHLFFMFPELILLVLAACILMGRYTGYRASELIRFKTA